MLGELFDPKQEFAIRRNLRPHWSQAGAVVFVTFRTYDSIPRDVVRGWENEKREWLNRLGIAPNVRLEVAIASLSEDKRRKFLKRFNRCREAFLDTCHGLCHLKRPELAEIVADSLLHFDGDRCRMGDFIVMPNHVHLLATFPSLESLKTQCDSWLHFTASQINKAVGGKGKLWQPEPFDHLVRNEVQYEYLREYVADNPRKARLSTGEFYYRRYDG